MTIKNSADALIEQLGLEQHPEGGWYRETWRGGNDASNRARGTAILFLLKAGEASHWHRVDADELWIWQAGDPLDLGIAASDEGPVKSLLLGADIASPEQLQGLVPAGSWQAARAAPQSHGAAQGAFGYTLVSCIVVPGFDFAGFELAPPDWHPGNGAAS